MGELSSMREDTEDLLAGLNSEFSHLQMYVSGIDVIILENQKLHDRIKKLSIEHSSMAEYWAEQVENMKLKSFETRVKLEDVFRNTIKVNLSIQHSLSMKFSVVFP